MTTETTTASVKADLSFLKEKINSAIIERGGAEEIPVIVGGFTVGYERREAPGGILRAVDTFFMDSMEGEALLKERGIIPITAVPRNAWNRLCKEARLVRLHPNDQGEVLLAIEGFFKDARGTQRDIENKREEEIQKKVSMYGKIHLGCIAFAIASGLFFGWKASLWFLSAIPFVYAHYLYAGSRDIKRYKKSGIADKKNIIADMQKSGKFIELVFPDGTDETQWKSDPRIDSRGQRGIFARVDLPAPPPYIVEILKKARGLSLEVVVEPGAIGFKDDIEDILAREWQRIEDNPIICWEHKGIVFVLGQFGEFRMEKDVIERVINSRNIFF